MDVGHPRFRNGQEEGEWVGKGVPKGPHLSLDCFTSKTRWDANVEIL